MSTETPNPQPGDKVRFTGHAHRGQEGTWVREDLVILGGTPVRNPFEFEVLERADDPTQDPIWTVREVEPKPPAAMSNTVVKFGDSYWLYPSKLGNGYGRLDWATVRESKVVGVVPGTPAAEAQTPVPDVRVENAPGLPIPVRQQAADRLVAGDVPGAVAAVVSGGLTREQAERYVRDMEEWQTYLNHHGRTEVDPVEADRMRAMGFDRQPEVKVSAEDRAEILGVLQDRWDEFYRRPGSEGQRVLHAGALSGVVADIVWAAIKRDRERRPS